MESRTFGILLLALAVLTMAWGLEWLAVVLIALGLALLFLFKKTPAVPATPKVEKHVEKAPLEITQPPIIIVEQGPQPELSDLIQEHIMIEKALGHEKHHKHIAEEAKKEVAGLRKEVKSLKKAMSKKKNDDGSGGGGHH